MIVMVSGSGAGAPASIGAIRAVSDTDVTTVGFNADSGVAGRAAVAPLAARVIGSGSGVDRGRSVSGAATASSNGTSGGGASGCAGWRHAATVNAAPVTNTADSTRARARSGIGIGFTGIAGSPGFAGSTRVPAFVTMIRDFADLRGFAEFDLAGFAGVAAFLGIGALLGPTRRGQTRCPGTAQDRCL
jgi:hypothetical protein